MTIFMVAVGLTMLVLTIVLYVLYGASRLITRAFLVGDLRIKFRSRVTDISSGEISIEAHPKDQLLLSLPLIGIRFNTGYARLYGEVLRSGNVLTRQFDLISGQLQPDMLVRPNRYFYNTDPQDSHGIPFENIWYRSEIGYLPSWFIQGQGTTWAIIIHGHSSSLAESLRLLPLLHKQGIPTLSITYRNDNGVPSDPSGYHKFGLSEWADLDAAVSYATNQGAEQFILLGNSMGAGIICSFLARSDRSGQVLGCVLESPALDLNRVIQKEAENVRAPKFLANIAKSIAGWRVGIQWEDLNYIADPNSFTVPILLIHSVSDETVPIETSDAFAASRTDIVSYLRVEGAPHSAIWNTKRDVYERAIQQFLTRLVEA